MGREHLRAYLTGIANVVTSSGFWALYPFFSDFIRLRRELKTCIAPVSSKYQNEKPGISFEKYLEVDYWLFEAMRRCYCLGLHRRDNKRKILDIGTGAAYFPYVCRYYGHEVDAVDVADNQMYNDIVALLGINRHEQFIRAYEVLVTEKRYDLVTAFMICFNCHKQPDLWHLAEWEYFLSSLKERNLLSSGEVFLSFNAETPEEPVSKELLGYFEKRGAKAFRSEVYFGKDYCYGA